MSFIQFLTDNPWVPALAGVALATIIGLIVWWCRRRSRQSEEYSPLLERDKTNASMMERGNVVVAGIGAVGGGGRGSRRRRNSTLGDRLDMDKFKRDTAEQEVASMNCRYYLRASPQYSLHTQLGDIGSRASKAWFAVARVGYEDQMMTMMPRSSKCCFPFSKSTRKVLRGMFAIIKHPYVMPVTDTDFLIEQEQVILMTPLNVRGSLKDLIYGGSPIAPWTEKYRRKGKGVSPKRISLIMRQIIEGVEFLRGKGIVYGHLHSGNVIMVDGVPRVAGYENGIFGYQARLYGLLRPLVKRNKDAMDSLCVGHLLYEMAMGFELEVPKPDIDHLFGRCPVEVIEVLAHIFYHPEERIPTLTEIKSHPYFARIQLYDLKEIADYHPPPIVFTSQMKEILRAVKKGEVIKTRSKSSRRRSSRTLSETSLSIPAG
eukprot:UC1_evm2s1863